MASSAVLSDFVRLRPGLQVRNDVQAVSGGPVIAERPAERGQLLCQAERGRRVRVPPVHASTRSRARPAATVRARPPAAARCGPSPPAKAPAPRRGGPAAPSSSAAASNCVGLRYPSQGRRACCPGRVRGPPGRQPSSLVSNFGFMAVGQRGEVARGEGPGPPRCRLRLPGRRRRRPA